MLGCDRYLSAPQPKNTPRSINSAYSTRPHRTRSSRIKRSRPHLRNGSLRTGRFIRSRCASGSRLRLRYWGLRLRRLRRRRGVSRGLWGLMRVVLVLRRDSFFSFFLPLLLGFRSLELECEMWVCLYVVGLMYGFMIIKDKHICKV